LTNPSKGTPGSERRAPFLSGLRVLEIADELGEYCGKLLAGLGADVVKIEPPGGEGTRQHGPFYDDRPDGDGSLYFWHYNFGKRGIVVDFDDDADVERFRQLASRADVLLDTRPPTFLASHRSGFEELRALNPRLIYARISPFGDDGPWAAFLGSDLVHLALGGVMMNCGYDPEPSGHYDCPPIAPQMWHSYQIAGEMAAMGILAALVNRTESGLGQTVSTSVHEAVSMNTESDIPNWVFLRQEHHRLTCRHSLPTANNALSLSMTKDGRWLLPYRTYLHARTDDFDKTLRLLKKWQMQADLEDAKYEDQQYRLTTAARMHIADVTDILVGKLKYERDLWRDAQDEGMTWAPVARPEENIESRHWRIRGAIVDVPHPELNAEFSYVGSRWYCADTPWGSSRRAPMLGEHTTEVLAERRPEAQPPSVGAASVPPDPAFALAGVRVVDLSWMLASAGAGRYLAALGAEVIKVEHESRWDRMRWGQGTCPPGGREQREQATSPIPIPHDNDDPNRSGAFSEINAGKLAVSLNLKHPLGKELLTRLIEVSDVVVEGFSPGTMDRMGFGYDRLGEINPKVIYASQSGLGYFGEHGSTRTFGPSAAAFAGISDMSGLPEPYPPAGIGYSYLDWFGAYNLANAVLAALYRRRVTGEGAHIDSSQVEAGIYLTGTAVLDFSVNGRRWQRYGNRSPYKRAAPHGAFRVQGPDRWIAIACFDQVQWEGLVSVLSDGSLQTDPRFTSLEGRLANQDALEVAVEKTTQTWEPYELMLRLQAAGVPAGVCQTAQDRCERDPQLAHSQWMVELAQSEIGTWPVRDLPFHLSQTPARMGGPIRRAGPNYGEDNDYVLGELLHLTTPDIEALRSEGAI